MSDKIVVTGGAGYIGWHLTQQLLDKGYQVHVLDDMHFGDIALKTYEGKERFEFQRGNILNIADVAKAFKDAYGVIHLAAVVGDPACGKNEEYTRLVNVETTKLVMDMCKYYEIQRFLFASSCSVYGQTSSDILLNEGSYLNPVSLYAETRILSENIIFSKSSRDICSTGLRLATAYGYSKRMRFDLAVNIMTLKGLTEGKVKIFGGKQYRPFVHCQDIARAFVSVLEAKRKKVDREVFNIGSNEQNYSIEELGQIVAKTLGVEAYSLPDREDDRSYRVDFSKANWLIEYFPQRTLEESVLEIKKAFQAGEFNDWPEDRYYNVKYDYML